MEQFLPMARLEVEKLLQWRVMISKWITQHSLILVPNSVLLKPLTKVRMWELLKDAFLSYIVS